MDGRPNRPPDISTALELPTEATLAKLRITATGHEDKAVRLIADVLARLCPAVEAIAGALPAASRGDFVSLDPDVKPQRAEG